jgi:WD40 repeat protein
LRVLEGHTDRVTAVTVLADGSRALSGSDDRTLRLWDLATGKMLRTFEGHRNWIAAVAMLADDTRALSGSWDNTLRLWDLETGNCLAGFTADAAIDCLAVARNNVTLAGSLDGEVHILEICEQ